MSNEQAAPETKGVTAELLATVDLGPEIEGMAGRQLRMRMVTIEPGGVFGPIHDHKDRPGTVYILQGTITDHRDGVATDYDGPGVGWPEDRNTTHWLENRGTIPAVEISVDIVRQEQAQARHLPVMAGLGEVNATCSLLHDPARVHATPPFPPPSGRFGHGF
jgi:quercetin dioxygenase-like cupin family protein